MVNSGSFDSDVDRNEKGEFTQPRRVAESPQSVSSVHAVSGSLCENDFTTQTADSLPPASQAIEPTATKTEYKCNMSELLLRARKILTPQCVSEDLTPSRANDDVCYAHETSIASEGYPTEIGKFEEKEKSFTVNKDDVAKCNLDKLGKKDGEIKTKVSVCCSVPLEKVQDVLKVCRTPAAIDDNTNFQSRKQISKKDMCLYCDRTFVTSTLKQKHVDRYHSLKYNRRLSARRQVAKHSVTACIFCDKLNNVECSLRQLFKHLVTEHPQKYFGCLDCETRFPNFQIYENHNIKIHGGIKRSTAKQNLIFNEEKEAIVEHNAVEKLDKFSNSKSKEDLKDKQNKSLESKIEILKTVENKANNSFDGSSLTNNALSDSLNKIDEEKTASKLKNRSKSKRTNENKKKEQEKLKQPLSTLSVALEPIKVIPRDKSSVLNENKLFVKEKSKLNWPKELRSKKVSVLSTKMGIKPCVRITRQQSKTLENVKNSKRKVNKHNKNDSSNKTSITTKYLSFQNHPYTAFDVSFRVKKITDHSIDNIKISSLTFDDVFDKAFFNRVKCNIQENLLNFVDGKLFKSVESENRISSFQKPNTLQTDESSQTYGCKLSANAVTPVAASLLTDSQFGEDIESQIEYGSKPSKKKSTVSVVNDEVHYKYFTRRKYQAVISENKQHRDLSKLDMWTQLAVKNRQQKILCEQKNDKEILEYKKSDEYKVKMQVEELDRILDKRGPVEDLREESIRTVALEKLNGTAVDTNIESYFDVTIILNELLNSLFTTDTSSEVTRDDGENKCTNFNNCQYSSEISQVGEEIPTMLNLRRIAYVSHENTVEEKQPNSDVSNEVDKSVMMELTGEWARSRIYVCAACGIKMPNAKLLIDHKNLFHEHVWCQHYEFVGNQGELYRHLSIPGLGKIGEIESSGSKMWRRSDARVCSKCNKQFNCLGDLHRHVLECGGDWSWMLARKKYKYRPYGSKTRKRRRGLLKFLHAFRERKGDQSRDKGKTIKKFDGPRQKPSDADTIERMLANLPAKRTTRKIISLKDGFQRSIKNQKISKTNKNKSLKQKKMQVNKTPQKSKSVVKNPKKSRRLLRSNSNTIFENKINMILPKFKKESKETKKNTNSTIRRHSVRNISRVLSNKLRKTNSAKCKITDAQEKIIQNSKNVPDHLNSKGDNKILNKNQNESNLFAEFKNSKKKNVGTELTNELQLKSIGSKKALKTSDEKKTATDFPLESVPRKKKHIKKGKTTATAPDTPKSSTLFHEDGSQNVQHAVVASSYINKKVGKRDHSSTQLIKEDEMWKKDALNQSNIKFRSAKGTFTKKPSNLQSIEGEASTNSLALQLTENNTDQLTVDVISKPSSNLNTIKKKKRNLNVSQNDGTNDATNISETAKKVEIVCNENTGRNKKNKYTFNLRKSKVRSEPKNVNTNKPISSRRKNNIRSKATRVIHNLKPASKKVKRKNTITKIIQVDGSSQSKPSTRSKYFKKELPYSEFLRNANSEVSHLNDFSQTMGDVSQSLNVDEVKIIPENNGDDDNAVMFSNASNLQLVNGFTNAISSVTTNITENNTECGVSRECNPETNNIENVNKDTQNENHIETSNVQDPVETEKNISDTNSLLLTIRPTVKKKINKKQRGLNDCIAMLTNKLQDKSFTQLSSQNNENTSLNPFIEELPSSLQLIPSKAFSEPSEEDNCDAEKNIFLKDDNTAKVYLEDTNSCAAEHNNDKSYNNSKNFEKNKENFELNSKLQQNSNILISNCHKTPPNIPCLWEQLEKRVACEINRKNSANNEVTCENTSICISSTCYNTNHGNNEDTEDELHSEHKLPYPSDVSIADPKRTKTQLEIQKNESLCTAVQLLEQHPLPKVYADLLEIQDKSDENVTCKLKVISDTIDLKQKSTEMGVFHNFSEPCDIYSVPKCQTQNTENKKLKFKKQRIKHERPQNIKKSPRKRYSNYTDKEKLQLHETTINGSRCEFSNIIAEANISAVVNDNLPNAKFITNLTENDQTVMSSTSEEFSNSGKENVIINEGVKLPKHRIIKQTKRSSKKKIKNLCGTPVDHKAIENEIFKQTKLDVPNDSIENTVQISDRNEFVDSEDDDVPLAEFVKKSVSCNITNVMSDMNDSLELSCEKPLSSADQNHLPSTIEEKVTSRSSDINQEDSCSEVKSIASPDLNMLSKEKIVPNEAKNVTTEVKLGKIKIEKYKNITVITQLQSEENVKKVSTNNARKEGRLTNRRNTKNVRRKKRHKITNSENRNDVLINVSSTANCDNFYMEHAISTESLRENVVPVKENCADQNNDSYPKIAVNPLNNFSTSEKYNLMCCNVVNDELHANINVETILSEKHKNQENLKENCTAKIDKRSSNKISNNLKNEYEECENAIDACSMLSEKDAEYKIRVSTTKEFLNEQFFEKNAAVQNIISQEEPVVDESNSKKETAKLLDTKPKPKPRLKTIFKNKRNVNVKKNLKSQNASNLNNIFCDICNKTFTRSENLFKHKRTLTHIAKLSELEALQAAEKLKQNAITEENKNQDCAVEENLEVSVQDNLNTENSLDNMDVNILVYDEYPKNTEISTFTLASTQDSLKLVDIISDVLSKPIDDEFAKPNNFSDLILQSDREIKRCKSLGERKSFESDKLQLFTNASSPTDNMDLEQKFVVSKLSNTADIIVEKQISLLENMIEDNFKSSDRIFNSSNLPANEEYSNQSSSSGFSLLSSSKQEECSDITFTHNTNIITNLIKPTLDEDNLIQTAQYEEISEDSSSSPFQVEEQKSRKALNRDEELFLECCSLLKSSSDVSDLSKKPAKSAQFLNNFGLKPLDELEWLEQKQLPLKKNSDFEYISNNFISDDSHINASVSENFYNDLSYSNSNMSNSNLNLKVLLDRNESDNLFSQPPIFEDISTESEGSSAKSLGNCFKTISSAIVLNGQDSAYGKLHISEQLSPSVESAQIPEEHDKITEDTNEEREKLVLKLGDAKSKAGKNKLDIDLHNSQDIKLPATKTTQACITDYAVPKRIKKNHNKKMLTKGAMKVFEGLKVSIPKDGLDMKEVLSCSPTSKRLQLEAEEENISADKKSCSEKVAKHNLAFNKIINNSESIKKIGNKLGLKITKKKYLSNQKDSFKIKLNNIMENDKKSHDIYDFEETQDNIDTFTNSSNSLSVYRSFRNKFSDKSDDSSRGAASNKKKSGSESHNSEDERDESHSFDHRCINDREKASADSSSVLGPPLKKIDMCKSITKNKCMIMGRIFKNAAKSKIGDEIKNIPAIENSKIVESFVLNCQKIQSDPEINTERKLSEEEMNILFDNLLNEEKPENTTNRKKERIEEVIESGPNTLLTTKHIDHKPKQKINKCKKRQRANSSDFSDEEFSIKKFPKRHLSKKNSKNNECVINLEQELKECIGVASRKSQRKCTSGKQNVLVEYWSSDESSVDADQHVTSTNYLENNAPELEEDMGIIHIDQNIENISDSNVAKDNERKENELFTLSHDGHVADNVDISNLKKKAKEIGNKQSRKLVNPHNTNKILKTNKAIGTATSGFEAPDSQPIASCRKKRSAVDTLYYWSSSSEDELQDVIEIKPLREEYNDEDRPLQHGWIVGDSPKKLVTMLAQAKGKKLDGECVKKNKKKRTSV